MPEELLDLNRPVEPSGDCPFCRLTSRPLWWDGERRACASCMTRLHPGRPIRFHAAAVEVAAQPTLL